MNHIALNNNQTLQGYLLINDTGEVIKSVILTKLEAETKNYALALNGSSLKYV